MTKQTAKINFTMEDSSADLLSNLFWRPAESIAINKLWNGEAAPDSRHAVARLLWSDTALYVRFDCRQKEPLFLNEDPRTDAKTMQLWEHDVCELFLAPARGEPLRYAEFEIAPTGEWLDVMVDWRKEDSRDWDYSSGMKTFSRIAKDRVIMVLRVPWNAFEAPPVAGDVWLGNLYRQVGSGANRGYLAWSPTMTSAPQFHVPEKFGELMFVK